MMECGALQEQKDDQNDWGSVSECGGPGDQGPNGVRWGHIG